MHVFHSWRGSSNIYSRGNQIDMSSVRCTQKCLPDLTASYPYRNFDLPNSAILLR